MYFDAHSDILTDVAVWRLRGETEVLRRRHLPRLRSGGVEGSIFAMWVDVPYDGKHADAYVHRARQIMDCAGEELFRCGEAAVVHNLDEMEAAVRAGKFYVFLGAEGLAAIGDDVERIDEYHAFGCRHAMLTWNEENALATGVGGDPDRGLTAAGRRAVRKLQDRRMLVDVSHLNETSFWDVMDAAAGPVVASHSNAKALCGAARNLTDDQLRAIRDKGGVVGLNAAAKFVGGTPAERTVEGLARHGAHMIDVMGIEHVGCGFDFCAFLEDVNPEEMVTAGLEDCSRIPNLFACFEKMGMSRGDMEKLARGNFQRVIAAAIA